MIALCALRDLEIENLPANTHRLFRRDLERIDQTADFAARILDRLARFDAQRHRHFLETLAKAPHAVFENGLPLERRERAHRGHRIDSQGDRLVDRFRIRERDAGRDLAAEFIGDFEIRVRSDSFIGDVVGITLLQHGTLSLC
ncbi:hypothetical protein PBP221_48180 [Paraburkholderia sp. 22B1P]|nr:hypothetical protein PBP221_48180 [Paraburkholderia sp. 22B1P]